VQLQQTSVSNTITRYTIDGELASNTQVFLVRPEDGTIVTGWKAFASPTTVKSVWVSPYDNLVLTDDEPRPRA
jgi:hypothetical protein